MDKLRAVLLLSRSEAYRVRRKVIAAEITGTIRFNPATVELTRRDGMSRRCIVNLDNLVTVRQDDLVEFVTILTEARMREVDRALLFAVGLD